jgi:mannose-6-phosphate isomerase-like protein (cupin superfamily)
MDVVSLTQAKRFSRERAVRTNLFDRPRLVCELICLEPDQEEKPRRHPASDELYIILEGRARVRVGSQEREFGPQEAVLAPPGVEHFVANPGPGRLTALVLVAPKPSRAAETPLPALRMPAARRGPPERPFGDGRGGRPPTRPPRGGPIGRPGRGRSGPRTSGPRAAP